MKRITALLLALCLLLSMAACGEDATTDPAQEGTHTFDQTGKPTDAPTQAPTEPPEVALAGKYLIYHITAGDEELNYFQISMSRLADTCIQLNADGTVAGVMNGSEIPAGTTWDAKTMTMTNGEGETNAITIADNTLVFAMEGGAMTFLKEGDHRLDDLPTPYQYLYDHIVVNGTQDDRGHTVVCEEEDGDKMTMTATADGKIFWNYYDDDGAVTEMELLENSETHTAVRITKHWMQKDEDVTCTAVFETAAVRMTEVPFTSYTEVPEPGYGITFREDSMTEYDIMFMLMDAARYLNNTVGITIQSLGFTGYYS